MKRILHGTGWLNLVLLALTAQLAGAVDFRQWHWKLPVTFTGYSRAETLTNFPALVVLSTNLSGFHYPDFLTTRADLRFTDASPTNELNYEVEKWDTNGSSYVWVQVPTLSSNTMINAYWGKDDATLPAYTTNGATWTNGFNGVWHLNETNGVTSDSSSNRYSATITGSGVQGATGQIGRAYQFTGTPSYVTLAMTNGATVTISAWARNTINPPTTDMLWCRATGAPYGDLFFNSGKISLNTGDSAGNPFCNIPSTVTQMLHYVTVIDPARTELFINGQSVGTATYKSLAGSPFHISSGVAYDWHGVIDEMQIASVVRSSNWVWACYMNQVSNTAAFNTYSNVVAGGISAVENAVAADITASGATLYGNLTSTGIFATVVGVCWGTNDGGMVQANWFTNVSLGAKDVGPVSNTISSLSAGTRYYYRFNASNDGGIVWAPLTANFTTPGAPLAADNGAGATNITLSSATLCGNITGGSPTPMAYFYWNTLECGTNKSLWANQVEGGLTSNLAVSVVLSGLLPNRTYFYRCYGSNEYGEVWAPTSATFIRPQEGFVEWRHKLPVTFSGYSRAETLTNFPALVVLSTNLSGFLYSNFQTNRADLRFTDASLTNELKYEVEKWDTNGSSYVWVQVPTLSSNTMINAYWGKDDATLPAYTTNGTVWDSGYKGVWHLKEATGATVADSTTNRINGTPVNSPTQAMGQVDGCLSFNLASSKYVNLGNTLSVSNFTVSFWWDGEAYNGWAGPMQHRQLGKHGFQIVSEGGGSASYRPVLAVISAANTEIYNVTTTNPGYATPFGKFKHFVWTCLYPSNVCLYVDGIKQALTGASYGYGPIGSGIGLGYGYVSGRIDETRISDIVRSSNWVWACYMNQVSNTASFNTYSNVLVGGTPVVDNAGVTDITGSGACLNGILSATGLSATVVGVCWGTNDGVSIQANWSTNVWLGQNNIGPVSNLISALSAGTRYYYRFHATNAAGEVWAPLTAHFTTLGGPSSADNGAGATDITQTSATLTGTVNGGLPTPIAYFFWNTVDGVMDKALWTNQYTAGIASNHSVTANLTGLWANQTYFYRCYGSNVNSAVWAPASTNFTTLAPTLAIGDAQVTKGPGGVDIVLTFPITLSATSALPITVNFATSNGLAIAGTDYTATNGLLTLPSGTVSGQIAVTVLGGNADQWPFVDLYVNLSNLTSATFMDAQAYGLIVAPNDLAETKIWTGVGDWTSRTNWSPAGAIPSPSDIVFIKSGTCIVSSATTYVPSLTVSNGATLSFSNWMSVLSVGNMTVRNTGLVTHIPCDTNAVQGKTNRVYIICTNLTVDAGGRIDTSGQGYRGATNAAISMRGQGPGGGYHQCGGGYGGIGGIGGYAPNNGGIPGASYGSATLPEDPGSGGGTHGPIGGDGGGAVKIEASELVTVNGTIAAHGIGMGNQGNGGSGGSVFIQCRAIAGSNGVVGADGGDNLYDNWPTSGGCGGGGRVALIYDITAQSIQNLSARPLLTISASQGYGIYSGGPGSIYLSDASFFPHPATLSGGQIIIPGFTEWTTANLSISNGMASFPDGFSLSVSNNLTVCGTGGGLLLTNGLLRVSGDMTLTGRVFNCIYLYGGTASAFRVDRNLSLWSGRLYYCDSRTTNTELVVGGNLLLTNASALYAYSYTNTSGTPFATGIKVASNMLLGASSWVYPISDPINGASGRFRVGRDLIVADTNSGFSADAAGFRGGISSTNRGGGPGAGVGSAGAGYGGAGGVGGYTPSIPGRTYGDSNAPSLPGSGGGMHVGGGGIGGKGGGLIWIEVEKTLYLNGIISANGGGPGYRQSGSGSGGGIYLSCRTLSGTSAVVRANGYSAGAASSLDGGGGGGGRIAIRRMIDNFQGTVTANGGSGYTNTYYGNQGTIVWYIIPPTGTMLLIH